ncbi:MAG: energy transducer TonB, partial [Gammaproteobacteria bacterium]
NFEALKNNLQNHVSTLEITLVSQRSEQKPERADYLANARQEGGGNTDADAPPQLPPPAAMEQAPPPAAAEQIKSTQPVLSANAASARQAAPSAKTQSRTDPSPAEPAANTQADASPTAQELVAQSMRIASLSAELDNAHTAYAQRPRRKFISARTREYKYAAYMEAWRAKVERIGNLNYPEEAKRNNLSGNLVLDVALNPDGKVRSVELRRSSGHKALDDAAVRIVQLAAPYAPFPGEILAETDILHITRTWQFLHDNQLATQ